ncbi:MAG: GNAT family N-acetyltransferase [Clostridiales bacterium]|nr:GNAT family N-acetyltransferase [Clostridiales bacterium]
MRYRKEIELADGTPCVLRSPVPDDAEAMIAHLTAVSGETDFMLRYPDEVKITVEDERAYIEKLDSEARSGMIVAEIGGEIAAIGRLSAVSELSRFRHRAEFGVSVRRANWGVGVGSAILRAAVDLAREFGYEQLELSVTSENARGIALYERFSFEQCGSVGRAFRFRDGRYAAEILMVLRL